MNADGSDGREIDALVAAISKAKATAVLVAPKIGGAKLADESIRKADGQLAGTPSQLFDAVALVLSPDSAEVLAKNSAAVDFVSNAFIHLKAIGANSAALPLLERAGIVKDDGVTGVGSDFIAAARLRYWDREAKLRTLA